MNAEFTTKTSPKHSVPFPARCTALWSRGLYEITTGGGYNQLAFFSFQSTQFTNAHSKASKPQSARFFYEHLKLNFTAQSASTRNFRRFSREKSQQNKISFNFFNAKAKKTEFQAFARQKFPQTQNFWLLRRENARRHTILRLCAAETAFPSKFHAISNQF